MAITPIVPITSIEPAIKLKSIAAPDVQPQETKTSFTFADMLKNMINDVNETDAQTKVDAVNMALGVTDLKDLANIEINSVRADMALRTVTSVRNKVLDAYTEIMRITI